MDLLSQSLVIDGVYYSKTLVKLSFRGRSKPRQIKSTSPISITNRRKVWFDENKNQKKKKNQNGNEDKVEDEHEAEDDEMIFDMEM